LPSADLKLAFKCHFADFILFSYLNNVATSSNSRHYGCVITQLVVFWLVHKHVWEIYVEKHLPSETLSGSVQCKIVPCKILFPHQRVRWLPIKKIPKHFDFRFFHCFIILTSSVQFPEKVCSVVGYHFVIKSATIFHFDSSQRKTEKRLKPPLYWKIIFISRKNPTRKKTSSYTRNGFEWFYKM